MATLSPRAFGHLSDHGGSEGSEEREDVTDGERSEVCGFTGDSGGSEGGEGGEESGVWVERGVCEDGKGHKRSCEP